MNKQHDKMLQDRDREGGREKERKGGPRSVRGRNGGRNVTMVVTCKELEEREASSVLLPFLFCLKTSVWNLGGGGRKTGTHDPDQAKPTKVPSHASLPDPLSCPRGKREPTLPRAQDHPIKGKLPLDVSVDRSQICSLTAKRSLLLHSPPERHIQHLSGDPPSTRGHLHCHLIPIPFTKSSPTPRSTWEPPRLLTRIPRRGALWLPPRVWKSHKVQMEHLQIDLEKQEHDQSAKGARLKPPRQNTHLPAARHSARN